MHRIATEIEIGAPVERVWAVLTDFSGYPRWNPFIRSVAGTLQEGATLTVHIQPHGAKAMRFRPRVLGVQPCRELRWKGRLLVPGLFDGEHQFRLQPTGAGSSVLHHVETFSGVLVPLLRRTLDGATRQGFIAMNRALKQEAERQ
ncbi:MAG: SRPBCC domain-containing protein [Hylemonella sp.]|nr:SRPBCC domain-containing protein [Hylemonella sp.]